jgi:hypothetical protein
MDGNCNWQKEYGFLPNVRRVGFWLPNHGYFSIDHRGDDVNNSDLNCSFHMDLLASLRPEYERDEGIGNMFRVQSR